MFGRHHLERIGRDKEGDHQVHVFVTSTSGIRCKFLKMLESCQHERRDSVLFYGNKIPNRKKTDRNGGE